jgi:hypothetical protein
MARIEVATTSGAENLTVTNHNGTNVWIDSSFLAARAPGFLDREPHVRLFV